VASLSPSLKKKAEHSGSIWLFRTTQFFLEKKSSWGSAFFS